MKIPALLKSHDIVLVNLSKNEVNNERVNVKISIQGVAISGKIADTMQVSSGINTRIKDGISITIDDVQNYVPYPQWDVDMVGWTVHAKDDYVIHNGVELAIIGYEEIKPFGKIEFIELVCQRR